MALTGRETGVDKIHSGSNSNLLDVTIVDSKRGLGKILEYQFFLSKVREQRASCYVIGVVLEDSHPKGFGGMGCKEHLSFLQRSCCKRSMEAYNCNKIMNGCCLV